MNGGILFRRLFFLGIIALLVVSLWFSARAITFFRCQYEIEFNTNKELIRGLNQNFGFCDGLMQIDPHRLECKTDYNHYVMFCNETCRLVFLEDKRNLTYKQPEKRDNITEFESLESLRKSVKGIVSDLGDKELGK